MTNEKSITGSPVPIENTTGKANPAPVVSVIGISIAKNNAPLYGQNASANNAPSKNEPSRPFV